MQNEKTEGRRLTSKTVFTSSFLIPHSVFILIALLALAIRLPQLGERPMHTDESVNAYITGDLLAGKSFHYDPQDRHGPALFVIAEPVARLLGAKNFSELTEVQLRLSTVITGTAMVLLFGAGVEMFGFIPCLIAALLFAFAPLPVYYSRYFIHETLFVAATFGLILSGWRALKNKSVRFATLAGFCAALMLACKETAVIHFFAIGVALFAARLKTPASTVPAPKMLFAALAVFIFTAILLFTWFGRNWAVMADLLHAIPRFAARAGGEGHEKPFGYYFKFLATGWSGALILALAIPGLMYSRFSARRIFLAVYALLVFAVYSAIPYKTPWLALNFWLPLALLAAIAIESFWLVRPKISTRSLVVVLICVCGFSIWHDTRKYVFQIPADEKNPYAYAHTVEDLLRLAPRLQQLESQNNLSNPRIAVVAADAWPLPWYLRKFSQVGFWQPGENPGAADFFITSPAAAEKLGDQLKTFRPEFFGVRPEVLIMLWSPAATNAATETTQPPQKP